MKLFSFIFLLFFLSSVSFSQNSNEVIYDLYKTSQLYKMGANAGYGLSMVGLTITPLGLSMATLGLSLLNINYKNKNPVALQNTIKAGYAFIGIGITSLFIGIIVWRNQERKYIDIVNRQYRYKNFIQKTKKR